MTLFGPYLAACALLVVAGASKALKPADTARALVAQVPRLPLFVATIVVRGLGTVETLIGSVAIALPRPLTASTVAASYILFALAVALLLSRGGPISTCGCFGVPDTPPTRLHVVIDLGFAFSASYVAFYSSHSRASSGPLSKGATLNHVLATQPLHGVPLAAASLGVAYLAGLAIGPLARVRSLQGGGPNR